MLDTATREAYHEAVDEAIAYARTYEGPIRFMQAMRQAVETRRTFTPNMVIAIRKIKAEQEARAAAPKAAPVAGLDLNDLPVDFDKTGKSRRHYAVEIDGTLRFLRITHRQSGWVYVDRQAGDNHPIKLGVQRPGGAYTGEAADALAAIIADPKAAMLRYGREIGSCGHCHRTLTDAESREYGIGPVCRKGLGW